MVDVERLVAVLGRVTSRLGVLEGYAEVACQDAAHLLADEVRLGHLKYTFQTAIEACIDAAQHVVAARGLGTPSSNAEAFRLLEQAGILPAEVASSLAGAVGFRNVLVHGYAEVDDRLVLDNLDKVGTLRIYVQAMTGLLTDEPGEHRCG